MLDGSKIREAREAAGLSQSKLAEIVGTSQQTIEKIELGKVERTSYLPEIYKALNISDAEAASFDTSIAHRILVRLDMLGKNPSGVALEAGLGRSSVRDILTGKVRSTRLDTLQKLTGPLECSLEYLTGSGGSADGRPAYLHGVSIGMVLKIAASQWKSVPTPEQIIMALNAGGFKIVPVAPIEPPTNAIVAIDDQFEFLREILERRKITPTEMARQVGLAASTLNKFLGAKNGPDALLSVRSLRKIQSWDAAQSE